ncbi:MAG: histidine kinase [Bacteroidota bacterium]
MQQNTMDSPSELLTLLAFGMGIMLLLAMACVLFFTFSQNRLYRERLQAQGTRLAHQTDLLRSNLLTQEAERARTAKDLHDEIGSRLNVIHLYLHQLARRSPEADESISELLKVVGDAINTTRRLTHDLLPPTLENFGLAVAIEEVCDRVQQTEQLTIDYEYEGERPFDIDRDIEVNLFRIFAELLSNTLKYAQAEWVTVRLWQQADQLILHYQDNGKSFDGENRAAQQDLGMQHIASRLQMMDGQQEWLAADGHGLQTKIMVKLPAVS